MAIYAFDNTTWTTHLDNVHSSMNGLAGLRAGDILVYDFRCGGDVSMSANNNNNKTPLRVVQWNIERGYKLEGIIRELTALNADIILLQELDISCQRSEYINVPLAIAKGLGALCAFVCEFHELNSTDTCRRDTASEAGCDYAFHGNAIISKAHALHSLRAFEHSAVLNWEACGWERREPRLGTRYVLTGCVDVCDGKPVTSLPTCVSSPTTDERQKEESSAATTIGRALQSSATTATTALPDRHNYDNNQHFARIQLYSLHLEIFCGPLMRLKQLSDALQDAKLCRRRFYSNVFATPDSSRNCSTPPSFASSQHIYNNNNNKQLVEKEKDTVAPHHNNDALFPFAGVNGNPPLECPPSVPPSQRHFCVVIGGDLNTIMHGIVRFSSLYSDDRMKWMSLGETEAEWLQRKVFSSANSKGLCSSARSRGGGGRCRPWVGNANTSDDRAACRRAFNTNGKAPSSWLSSIRESYWRYCYGLEVEHAARLSNEELKLFDAFDKLRDVTLDNPAYKGFVSGKLDWLLLSNLRVEEKVIGNNDYSLSDHKYLVNDVVLPPFAKKGTRCSGSHATSSGGVGDDSFFWADDSLAAAYNEHPDRRSVITSVTRAAYVGAAIAVALYIPSKYFKGF